MVANSREMRYNETANTKESEADIMSTDRYESPLSSRYASYEMQHIFSPDKKFSTWRRLWVALARAEMELGLPVTREQVAELEAHVEDIRELIGAVR